MKANQMSDEERKTYAWLVNETKPEINRYRRGVVIASIGVFLVGLGIIIWYWYWPTVAYAILVGGGLYVLWGALLLALGGVLSPSTLGLMSMAYWGGNVRLFTELMKSRFSARVGIYFIVGGFSIHASVMLVFGS